MTLRSSLSRVISVVVLAGFVLPRAAAADHPGALASGDMSPLTLALVSGGLALATVLVVVVVVMLLTRKPERPGSAAEPPGGER